MPPPAALVDEPNLLRALAGLARRTPDGALVGCGLVGLIALSMLVWRQPDWWPMLVPLVALGAFGIWGVLDRALAERAQRRGPGDAPALADQLLTAARALVAVAGVASGVAAMFGLMAGLLGKMIS